jgi:hypothetical protein
MLILTIAVSAIVLVRVLPTVFDALGTLSRR